METEQFKDGVIGAYKGIVMCP